MGGRAGIGGGVRCVHGRWVVRIGGASAREGSRRKGGWFRRVENRVLEQCALGLSRCNA